MIYHPKRVPVQTAALRGLQHRTLRLTASDGVAIAAWHVKADSAAQITLYFLHGNGGNLSYHADFIANLARMGVDVFAIDYRGFGLSEGAPSEAGLYRDACAGWRYLTNERKLNPQQILLLGQSLGGAVAIDLATSVEAAGLLVEGTFTSVPALAVDLHPWLPANWITRHRFPSFERIGSLKMPIWIMHSQTDEVIPYAHGLALFRRASAPKRFISLQGLHTKAQGVMGPRYFKIIDAFVKRVGRPSAQGLTDRIPAR